MLLLIKEYDHSDNEQSVIGIADSIEKSKQMVEEYYGIKNMKELKSYVEYEDPNNEWCKRFEISYENHPSYEVTVEADWYCLNRL